MLLLPQEALHSLTFLFCALAWAPSLACPSGTRLAVAGRGPCVDRPPETSALTPNLGKSKTYSPKYFLQDFLLPNLTPLGHGKAPSFSKLGTSVITDPRETWVLCPPHTTNDRSICMGFNTGVAPLHFIFTTTPRGRDDLAPFCQ